VGSGFITREGWVKNIDEIISFNTDERKIYLTVWIKLKIR
jgi:formate dehydrogenase assembly factor FdhD